MPPIEVAREKEALVSWFRREARPLPWRKTPRVAYEVLVSELMLQQTQASRVAPRFEAFIDRFPTVRDLAAAGEEEVVEAWSGLGYYRRARALHRAGREIVARGGEVPASLAALKELPGVGDYTAAAVASLAYGIAVAVVDGNVERVAARVLALPGAPGDAALRAAAREWAQSLVDTHDDPGEVNEALMELGASLCTPSAPACTGCPLGAGCQARKAGAQLLHPAKRRERAVERLEWVASCCRDPDGGRWLLRQVEDGPVLRGLWLPPLVTERRAAAPEEAARAALPFATTALAVSSPVRHSITYRRLAVIPVLLEPAEAIPELSAAWRWASPTDPGLPTSSLLAKLVRSTERHREEDR